MGRFIGKLSTESHAVTLPEMRVGHYTIPAEKAVAADGKGLIDKEALITTAKTVTVFENEMPYPMTVVVVASAAHTGKVKIFGADIAGQAIDEEVQLNGNTPQESTKAFARVDKIILPVKSSSETVSCGWGTKFALPYRLNHAAQIVATLFDGADDAGTVTVNAEDLSKNIYAPVGTVDGEKPLDFYILV